MNPPGVVCTFLAFSAVPSCNPGSSLPESSAALLSRPSWCRPCLSEPIDLGKEQRIARRQVRYVITRRQVRYVERLLKCFIILHGQELSGAQSNVFRCIVTVKQPQVFLPQFSPLLTK